MWRHGAHHYDDRVLDNDKAVAEAIEAVWLTENQVRIRFGQESPLTRGYDALVNAVDALLTVYNRHGNTTGLPTAKDQAQWTVAVNGVIPEQKRFVETVRAELGLAAPVRFQAVKALGRRVRRISPQSDA